MVFMLIIKQLSCQFYFSFKGRQMTRWISIHANLGLIVGIVHRLMPGEVMWQFLP
jgi:hypothetical protein